MSWAGTLLDVQDKTSKDGTKHYWAVSIDTDAKGETVFNLWDAVFAGKPGKDSEEPICDVHKLVGQRVIFDCQPGKPRLDKDGNETGEHWPATLTMISPSAVPAANSLLADDGRDAKVEAAQGIAQHLEAAQRHLGAAMELARGM